MTNSKLEQTIACLKLERQDLEDSSNYALQQLKIRLAGSTQALESAERRIDELESKVTALE